MAKLNVTTGQAANRRFNRDTVAYLDGFLRDRYFDTHPATAASEEVGREASRGDLGSLALEGAQAATQRVGGVAGAVALELVQGLTPTPQHTAGNMFPAEVQPA